MYRHYPTPGEFPRIPAPYGHPSPRGPPPGPPNVPRIGGPFGPRANINVPLGHLPPASCRPFLPHAPDSHYRHSGPIGDHFINTHPHCSSFSIDRSTLASQQILPPADQQHLHMPQWNPPPLEPPRDDSEKAGEEFLRCLAANQPLPDYLKGDMAQNLAEALMSANALKAAVQSDFDFLKHRPRSKSRSRSRGKSRARSRARSRSRGQSGSRSRAKSRARSKSRAPSRSRGKSCARSKSQARSRSRSRGKSRPRDRSRSRGKSSAREHRSKRSPSQGSCGSRVSTGNKNLLQGLKQVMNSKELEHSLPSLKDAILTVQASSQGMEEALSQGKDAKINSLLCEQEHMRQMDDSMLLPHDRVGSDFSWIQASSQEDSAPVKPQDLYDEESFLYGKGDFREKQPATAAPFTPHFRSQAHSAPQPIQSQPSLTSSQSYLENEPPMFSSLGDLLDVKQFLQTVSPSESAPKRERGFQQEPTSHTPDVKQFEKIKGMLKNIGLNLGTADINKMMEKFQEQRKEGKLPSPPPSPGPQARAAPPPPPALIKPALGQTNVWQALQSLQSLIKATKENRAKSDPHGACHSQKPSNKDNNNKVDDKENKKKAGMQKKEHLLKELEELLKDEGCDYLIPVIGFYCMTCEEFLGDLKAAESHADVHRHNDSSRKHTDKGQHADSHTVQDKGLSHHHSSTSTSSSRHERPTRPPDRRDQKDSSHQSGDYERLTRPPDKRDQKDSSHQSGDYERPTRPPDRRDQKDSSHQSGDYHRDERGHRDPRDEGQHRRPDLKRKVDEDPRGHRNGQDQIYLKDKMFNESLMITVSRGQSPPPKTRVEEVDKSRVARSSASAGPTVRKHGKIQQDGKGKPCKDGNKKDDGDDSSDGEKGKTSKGKSPKKKKKGKKKKDKKDKKKKK